MEEVLEATKETNKHQRDIFSLIKVVPHKPYFEDNQRRVILFNSDCFYILPILPENSVDMIFADPPYFLSNGGFTCHAGRKVSVNKGKWDISKGREENYLFTLRWLRECQRILTPNGTIWVSGTAHIIYTVGYAMQDLGYKILNDIAWFKVNPPPNLSCRYFTHSTETILWAAKNKDSKHYFNYPLMKKLNNDRQMLSLWSIKPPGWEEKKYGKHPTQKPLQLLDRIVLASTKSGDIVLDPFSGSGTTGYRLSALSLSRRSVNGLTSSSASIRATSPLRKSWNPCAASEGAFLAGRYSSWTTRMSIRLKSSAGSFPSTAPTSLRNGCRLIPPSSTRLSLFGPAPSSSGSLTYLPKTPKNWLKPSLLRSARFVPKASCCVPFSISLVWLSDFTPEPDIDALKAETLLNLVRQSSITQSSLKQAIGRRNPSTGLTHHSDRGSQYASGDYQALLKQHKIIPSRSRKGDCRDNAVAESFLHTLKAELIHGYRLKMKEEVKRTIFEYVEVYDNRKRMQSYLGYMGPFDYGRRSFQFYQPSTDQGKITSQRPYFSGVEKIGERR